MRLYEVSKRPAGGQPHEDKYLGVFASPSGREAIAEAGNWEFGADLDESLKWELRAVLWDGRRPPHGGDNEVR